MDITSNYPIMRVYHFLKEQYGLEALRKKRLKIARINELNDPFEFMGADLSDLEFREAIGGLKDYLNERWGLLCFSKVWESPVQWTHYANRHKGLCLGFDVPDGFLTKVKYENERLPVDDFLARIDESGAKLRAEKDDYIGQPASPEETLVTEDKFLTEIVPERLREDTESDEDGQEFMEKILAIKFSHWSYEKEYRLFISLDSKETDDLYYFDFADELVLREVLVGARSWVTLAEIEDTLGEMAGCVDVFKVREAYRIFAMVRDEIEKS